MLQRQSCVRDRRLGSPPPTFEELRGDAYRLLGDVEDVLVSDWQEGTAPTRRRAADLHDARSHIARAKAALNRAAR